MKILVTGTTGQLGYDVCQELRRRNIPYLGTSSADMDITDGGAVWQKMVSFRPDAVIHCAAYTAVDRAEDEAEQAYRVNEMGTRNIAKACKLLDAKLLYLSTDYVFPGTGAAPYETDAMTGPLNTYGKTKLAGEKAVKELLEKHFIVRISWVFGRHGNNFVKTMLRLAETKQTVQVVCDQIGSPTYTVDLSALLCDMVSTEKYGVYHATNEGVCSWAEFAAEIFREAGKNVVVQPVSTAEYKLAKAVRPLNSRLDKGGLVKAGFAQLPPWQNALRRFLTEIQQVPQKE